MDIVHHFKLSFDENETGIAFDQVEVEFFFVQIRSFYQFNLILFISRKVFYEYFFLLVWKF